MNQSEKLKKIQEFIAREESDSICATFQNSNTLRKKSIFLHKGDLLSAIRTMILTEQRQERAVKENSKNQ